MLEITIDGLPELFERLGVIEAIDVLMDPTQRSVLRLQRAMAQYPPQPPTDYRRTGRLGRSWTTTVNRTGQGVVGEVGNNTSYGPFVQSAQFQARWMRHWGNTDERVMEEQQPEILQDYERSVQAALG